MLNGDLKTAVHFYIWERQKGQEYNLSISWMTFLLNTDIKTNLSPINTSTIGEEKEHLETPPIISFHQH